MNLLAVRRLPVRVEALQPLAWRDYRRLWLASFLWYLARWVEVVVVGWLVLDLTDSAWHVALVGFYRNAPLLCFGLLGGVIADRMVRRTLLALAQGLNCAVMLGLWLLLVSGGLQYWHLAVGSLLLGLSWTMDWPARRTLIADIVGRPQILRALVLETTSMNITKVLGPLLGGSLVGLLGAAGCFLLLLGTYLGSLGAVLSIRQRNRTPAGQGPVLRTLVDGLRAVVSQPAILGVLSVTMAMNMLVFPYVQLLPVFARDIHQAGPVGLGLLAAGDGLGSLLGAALLSLWPTLPRGRAFLGGSFLMSLALLAFSLLPALLPAFLALVAMGVCHAAFSAYQSAITLTAITETLRGRAMGALALAIGTAPLGALLMGVLATLVGAPAAVGLSAALGALWVLLTAWRLADLRRV